MHLFFSVPIVFFSPSQSNQNNIKKQVIISSRLNEKPDWQKFIPDFMTNYERLGQPGLECIWPSLNDKPGFNDSSDNDLFVWLDSIVLDWKSKNYDVQIVREAVFMAVEELTTIVLSRRKR